MWVGQPMAKSTWRTVRWMFGAMAAGIAFTSPAAAQDAYFRKTRSEAIVSVAPVASSISKGAVFPFKAPTERIGSSVSDIFQTELRRAGRHTLVERGQMDRVLGGVDEYATTTHRGRNFMDAGRISADAPCGFEQEALPPNPTRHYRVKTIDVDGLESEWSDPIAGSTKPPPYVPANLELEWRRDRAFLHMAAGNKTDLVHCCHGFRRLGKPVSGVLEMRPSS